MFISFLEMCQVNLLKSHSTVITCYKDTIQIDCGRSVGPGVSAKVSCKSRYQFEPNAKKEFVCQENGNWNGERTECKADCGQLVPKATALAAGAIEANSHGVPWYAGIYYNDNQICGGTIISGLFLNLYYHYSLFCYIIF